MLGRSMSTSSRVAAVASLLGLLGAFVDGCSLSDIARTDCASDTECAAAFGAGSTCSAGFCSEPMGCTSGHDCRKMIGGGACVNGACVSAFPTDPACKAIVEPPDLLSQPLIGASAPLVIGGIFSLDAPDDVARTQAVRLAVQEINQAGLNGGQRLGIVFCDNGGPGNMATGDARKALDVHAFDYLAGTLGVPYIVGPLTSADSLQLVNELKNKSLPTVIISPSATSPALTTTDDRLHPNDPYGLFWRTCPSDQLQGQVLAKSVIEPDTSITSVTVVYINDAYGQGLATVFQSSYGVARTFLVPYPDTTPGDPAALAKLATDASAMGGDAVLLIAEHGSIAVQIIEAMLGKPIASKKFFFTDGSMDQALYDPALPAAVKAILSTATGTAPANPSGQNYSVFSANLAAQFGLDASTVSFLAHSYDATYVGAFGLALASKDGTKYDGLDVAAGMAQLSAGDPVPLNGVSAWPTGKGLITTKGKINVDGVSGPLDFDPKTGEAPGGILIWSIDAAGMGFPTVKIVPP
jgi:branched-chain amino acid transport system substrate-binding protein